MPSTPMTIEGQKSAKTGDFPAAVFVGPATKLVLLTKGSALANGSPKALWVGTAGTANIKDLTGAVCANFPLIVGKNDVSISALDAGGTATDIWGMY